MEPEGGVLTRACYAILEQFDRLQRAVLKNEVLGLAEEFKSGSLAKVLTSSRWLVARSRWREQRTAERQGGIPVLICT